MRRPTTRVEDLHKLRRWTEEEGELAAREWRASGLDVAAFARRHRLHPLRVTRWLKRLPAPAQELAVVPVTVVTAERSSASVADAVEIALTGGTRVVRVPVPVVVGEADLVRLVRAVEAA